MTWRELLSVSIKGYAGVQIYVSWILVAAPLVALAYLLYRKGAFKIWGRLEIVDADVNLGNIGHIRLRPSYREAQIAHRAWVELSTRKAGLPLDEKNDVIVEIYNSWYELFGRVRDLAKEVPAQRLRASEDARELVRLLVDALNEGLRPHLTQWQARFRRWYTARLEQQAGASPQEVQAEFPAYKDLIEDLRRVNQQLVEYAEVLKRIAQG